ncbi:ankyrin domain protein [Campylobacter pinnipediorum subsp. pinnipediorum]|uniref:ankyrin repeat domain-containing protein n=1 Tax=Campylobacter pinnipediorum TaxID=1965231 RepID=UPI000995ADCC|nr:ankyrin repeat domain-containing protein [Campylobacter pinnipediorum]AQW83892.1 ankyrin domain protein [Campylobacter pinnipediorum subsp. pinnipediorum]
MKKLLFTVFLIVQVWLFADTTCADLKNNSNSFFKTNPSTFSNFNDSLFECDGSIFNLKDIQNLLKVSKQIRGDNINCVGSNEYFEKLNKFKFTILKASFSPYAYAKTLPNIESADIIREKQRGYFRYWAHQAFYNFYKFKEFWNIFNQAQTPLVKFYEDKGFETMEAAYFATAVLSEFLNYSVGSYINLSDVNIDISKEQKLLSERVNISQIMSILYSKNWEVFELNQILNTALLYNKGTEVLNEIIKRGVNLESGDESAIFFALNNLDNVELLINNGADVNHKNSFGKSPIFYAVELKNPSLVKLLINNGADVNDTYIDQNTKTAMLGLGSSLPFYISMCALEHTKRTLFMHASANSNPEILRILIDNGVVIDYIDELGFNAMDYAKMTSNVENIEFLKSLGIMSKGY